MTLTRISAVLATAGAVAIIAGVALLWSLGVACIVGGGLAIVASGLLYDPKARA